jgi:hypothetical protein
VNFVQYLSEMLKSLFKWWVVVAPWQQGIRVRLGKYVTLLEPGIHVKLPIIDVVFMQAVRSRAQWITHQTLTTSDGKNVSLASGLQYEITNLLKLYETLHNPHDTIEQQVHGVIADYIFGRKLAELKPEALNQHVMDTLRLDVYGITAIDFKVTSFVVVRTLRLINGEVGTITGYDQRIETSATTDTLRP